MCANRLDYWRWNSPITRSVRLSVGRSVGRSVGLSIIISKKVPLPSEHLFNIRIEGFRSTGAKLTPFIGVGLWLLINQNKNHQISSDIFKRMLKQFFILKSEFDFINLRRNIGNGAILILEHLATTTHEPVRLVRSTSHGKLSEQSKQRCWLVRAVWRAVCASKHFMGVSPPRGANQRFWGTGALLAKKKRIAGFSQVKSLNIIGHVTYLTRTNTIKPPNINFDQRFWYAKYICNQPPSHPFSLDLSMSPS